MYIYIAINNINGKVYIGQTTYKSIEQRKQKHFQEVRSEKAGKRKSPYFHNAIKKYGEDAFDFYELDKAVSIKELNEKEAFYIALFNSTDKQYGYNLDSGGTHNIRHPSTLEKLKESTMHLHATNEQYHAACVEGLRKGTETWKQICTNNRIEKTCPICKSVFVLPPNEAKKKTYCSRTCSKIGNHQKYVDNFKLASAKNREKKLAQNEILAKEICLWAINHAGIVLTCPANKISTTLFELRDYIESKYGIKDWRTISESVGCHYKKDLLQYLKNHINENICCSGLN